MKMKFERPDLVLRNYEQETKRDKLYPYVVSAAIALLIILLSIKEIV